MTAKFSAQDIKTGKEYPVTEIHDNGFATFDDFAYFVNRFWKENKPVYASKQYIFDYYYADD